MKLLRSSFFSSFTFLFYSDQTKHTFPTSTQIHHLLTRNSSPWHQGPESERFKRGASKKSPSRALNSMAIPLTREACKTKPQPLAALHKTIPISPCSKLHIKKLKESNWRNGSPATLHGVTVAPVRSHFEVLLLKGNGQVSLLPNLRPYVVLVSCKNAFLSHGEETWQSAVIEERGRFLINWRPLQANQRLKSTACDVS